MNDVELWKRLDAMHETFKSIARSLETMAETQTALRNCINSDEGYLEVHNHEQ